MGTNYYITGKSEYCEHCGRGEKEIHLGKSSMGWCFSVHVYPDDGINNLKDVLDMIGDTQIKDEYGTEITKKAFLSVVKDRVSDRNDTPAPYKSWADFHESNGSLEGPNGLVRSKISSHCIGHGVGTWDYMVGEYC